MHHVHRMNLLNSSNDLVKEPAGFMLGHSPALNNVIKELPPTRIFHNQIQLALRLDDFKQLDHVRVSDQFQKLHLSGDPLYVSNLVDTILLKELDSYTLASQDVAPELNLPECSFTNGFAQYVMA
jgi:hypothetical protein